MAKTDRDYLLKVWAYAQDRWRATAGTPAAAKWYSAIKRCSEINACMNMPLIPLAYWTEER